MLPRAIGLDWLPPNESRNESLPSKPVSAIASTSLTMGMFGSERTNASIAVRVVSANTGSLWVCRLSAPQIPAYPMIVEPDPGSTALNGARLPWQPSSSPSKVWSAPNWWPSSCAR